MSSTLLSALPFSTPSDIFCDNYRWTLDPVPSLGDLLVRMREEMDRYEGQESRINLYLFSCAIACTIDDHLAQRSWDLSSLAQRLPAVRALEAALNVPQRLRARVENRRLVAWRGKWTQCVDAACSLLGRNQEATFFDQASALLSCAMSVMPERALVRRMRIPEAFRCQDLTHHDVYSMMEQSLPALADRAQPIAVVGPRTAGAYFAPLAAAYLRELGYPQVEWISVRPKNGFTSPERGWLRGQICARATILIVDDHQNTGHTQKMLLTALRQLGAQSQQMAIAVPGHPVSPRWSLPEEIERGVRIFVLPPEQRYKVKLLETLAAALPVNEEFERGYAAGFQARVKRVLDGGRVMAKSTGWGWLGYHAWIASRALAGFVPPALGFGEGILYSEWINAGQGVPDVSRIAAYVAKRVDSLPLEQDPYLASPNYRWCGWDELVTLLRRVYGPLAGRLHTPGLRTRLRRCFAAPHPMLPDGRMAPCEWIAAGSTVLKTDYEQHNFGGGEADLADPAWDLAAAIYEFGLTEQAERQLVDEYLGHTADANLPERLLLHKLLYAAIVMRGATYWMARKPAECDRRYREARDFAAFQLARHCGRHLPSPARWTRRLFFLDLDGVLDWPHLGFAHTTANGVRALQHLAAEGYAVVLNTLRSVRHVQEYCNAYHLPGGVAEMGSVFWDAVEGRELPLVEADTLQQLGRVKEELARIPGVLFDGSYTYSIYAYRYAGGQPRGMSASEVEEALRAANADQCGYVLKGSGTHIIQKDRSKAASLPRVRSYLNCANEPIVAIDDTDAGLLAAADIAYIPANAAREVRGAGRRMRGSYQNGLLQAAVHLTGRRAAPAPASEFLIDDLLSVPDRR